MTIALTDGGIETRIIYEFKHAIDDFESFELLADESGRDILCNLALFVFPDVDRF